MEYGDAYDNEENKPFDFFRSSACFGFSSNQPFFSRLNLLCRLWGTPISDTDNFGLYLSRHMSFDFHASYFWRHAHYREAQFEDVDAKTFELRAGLTYKL